ncbi:hypothetical protein Trydic_g22324 [Trypoxylus dichotomus]
MKVRLTIFLAIVATCESERRHLLVNQYRYDIPVYHTPLTTKLEVPFKPGKPAEVYGVPPEYQQNSFEVVKPVALPTAKPILTKYRYNVEIQKPTVPKSTVQSPKLVVTSQVPKVIKQKPRPNILSSYRYQIDQTKVPAVVSLPPVPYPPAAPVPSAPKASITINKYKYNIKAPAVPSLPSAPYPPVPSLLVIPKPNIVNAYKFKLKPIEVPSLPLAPYPPTVSKPPVVTKPNVVSSYKFNIHPSVAPVLASAPYPPVVAVPQVPKPSLIVSKYNYKIDAPTIPLLSKSNPVVISTVTSKPVVLISSKPPRPIVNKYSFSIEAPAPKVQDPSPTAEIPKVDETKLVIPKPHAVYGVPL